MVRTCSRCFKISNRDLLYLFSLIFYNQLSSTVSFTRLLYSFRDVTNRLLASAFAGEFGLGSCKRDCIEVKIAATSYVGDLPFKCLVLPSILKNV